MPIIHITGPKKSGKTLLANSLRNTQIGQSKPAEGIFKGALLIDDNNDGEPRYLLEKLMLGEALGIPGVGPAVPRPASEIPWKDDPLVVVVGDKVKLLDEFEKLAPGFLKKFGPVRKMPVG